MTRTILFLVDFCLFTYGVYSAYQGNWAQGCFFLLIANYKFNLAK